MELRILGTSASFAGKNEGCSSYLFAWKNKHYLIETGPGSLSALQSFCSYLEIAGVFLSHLHADHVSDIYTLRYAVYTAQKDGRMKKPLPIYLPFRPRSSFRFIKNSVKKEFSITRIGEKLMLELDGLAVRFMRTSHSIEAYAMKFSPVGSTASARDVSAEEAVGSVNDVDAAPFLVYTSDTSYFDGLVPFCRGAKLLLAEATLQEQDRAFTALGHMTAEEAGTLASRAGVQKLLLTHIWPEYDKSRSLEEARRSFKGEIILAAREQVFDL